MIEDFQKFETIGQDDDTKEEPIVPIFLLLSTIESMNGDSWKGWVDQSEKFNITFKSGLQVTVLGSLSKTAKLWRDFLKQQTVSITSTHN